MTRLRGRRHRGSSRARRQAGKHFAEKERTTSIGQVRELRRRNQQLEQELEFLQKAWQELSASCGRYRKAAEDSARIAADLHHAQKMEALGNLASGVAHDFNNLLMGIGSCAEVACHTLPPGSQAHPYLQEIKSSALSGATISRHLLAFARKRPVGAAIFELNGAVERTRIMLEHLLGEDIRLVVSLDAKDSRVCTDPGHIEQILLNLAVNARDAMEEGGTLTLSTGEVVLADGNSCDLAAGRYISLTVTDSGPGIAPHVLSHIFDAFFTTKGPGKGTGLGLSTVRGIVTRAGGAISASNPPGGGARFEILWPKAEQPITQPVDACVASDLAVDHATVLLVEDHRAVRIGTRFYLEQGGLSVIEASSGEEALELATCAGTIDVLVTDVVLPGISGKRLAQRLRMGRPDLGVVFMSAHPTEWLAEQGRMRRPTAVLQKPFGKEQLLARVRAAVCENRPEPAPAPSGEAERVGADQNRRGRTILVVEDEPMSRDIIASYLHETGWIVLTATDGPEAIEVCDRHPEQLDVLLTDYTLPSIQGDALARTLRGTYPDLSVVYMSGYSDLDLDPPGPLLTKPLALPTICDAVERATRP